MRFGRRRTDWLLLGLTAAFAVLAWVFVKVGSEVTEGELAGIDVAIREVMIAHRSTSAVAFFNAITMLGSKPVLVILAALVGWWVSKGSKTVVVLLALCALVSAEFVDLLKEGFGVGRPPAGTASQRSLSFPSGHVAGAAAIGTLLSYVAWRQKTAVRFVIPACILLVGLIAVSRVYLDKHWASDTVGGALIGATLGLACCGMYEWIRRRGPKQRPAD